MEGAARNWTAPRWRIMKIVFLCLVLVSQVAFAAEKKCSEADTKTFLKHYLPFISAVADGYYKTGDVISEARKNKWDFDKFETEYANMVIMLKPKYKKHMDELEAFQKIHPECNEKQILASLNEKK